MHPFHERLARVGLAAADQYGSALAGGYAVQAAGLLDRPSEDVDLFTAWNRTDEFDVAVNAVVDAYRGNGLHAAVELQHAGSFARLRVTDPVDGGNAKVEMGVDWRANDPVRMSTGRNADPHERNARPQQQNATVHCRSGRIDACSVVLGTRADPHAEAGCCAGSVAVVPARCGTSDCRRITFRSFG